MQLSSSIVVHCQDTLPSGPSHDSINSTFDFRHLAFNQEMFSSFKLDSNSRKKLTAALLPLDTNGLSSSWQSLKHPAIPFPTKPLLVFGSGYISYNYYYRSGSDSSFIEDKVGQHLVAASINAVIAQTLPVRISYFERRSNSIFFKDYRDVRIDVDVQRYRQLKMQKALSRIGSLPESLRDPLLAFSSKAANLKLDQYRRLLNDQTLTNELIHARETLTRKDFPDTSARYIDSSVNKARRFLQLYDTLLARKEKYQHLADSLSAKLQSVETRVKKVQQIVNGKQVSQADMEKLENVYGKDDPSLRQLRQAYSGIRSFSIGRTMPNFSGLTLQNVNVNGLSTEYNKNNLYLAAAAGIVDFRLRDFLYSQQKLPRQYVYSARVGYGQREKDNIILTYFRGRKQLFGNNFQRPSADIQGVSVAGQFYVLRQVRVYGEVAQSGVPYALGGTQSDKATISFSDRSQRAYSAGFSAWFPKMQTSLEGYYQHAGLNYQAFNSFQYNAVTTSWSFRASQSFWRRQLSLQAGFRKNDFYNPLVLQRYNANTVFKNVMLTFRRTKWPTLSVGYLPASQYTAVGNQVYENYYQTVTGNISYQYNLGVAKASSVIAVSRFFNDNRDSGLVYYNSKNFFWNQVFFFRLFTANLNVSTISNNQHRLLILEEGVSATFLKKITAGFSIKINNLNQEITKLGFNASTRAAVPKLGEFSLWMEQNYLPAIASGLYKYEVYNIGFTRYF